MVDKYVKIPKEKYEEYLALENFYENNLTKTGGYRFIFPLIDLADYNPDVENLYSEDHFIIDINYLNKMINKRTRKRFVNHFMFEINKRDIYELCLLMTGDNNSLVKHVATIKFSDRCCIIKKRSSIYLGERVETLISYLDDSEDCKSYTTDKFWDSFIRTIVNIL